MHTFRPLNMIIDFAVTLSLCGVSSAVELNPKELQTQVRSIFVAKCSECHGRGLSRPRAALYLHELGQAAANREWVVPHDPENSYLWTLIRDDDMPAKGAKAGPLNAQEKEIVRAWIAAGAPVAPPSASPASSASPPSSASRSQETITTPESLEPSLTTRLLALLGRFHVLVVHFPIALIMAAALAELVVLCRGSQVPLPVVHFCILLGAAGAVAAVALGWLHAEMGSFSSSNFAIHRWLGSAAGLWATASALLSERDRLRGRRSMLFRVVLWTGTCVVAATAHFGGLMVHGDHFLDF